MRRQGPPGPAAGGSAGGPARSLDALFDPGSITVVGASDDPAKWGHILSRRALESQRGPAGGCWSTGAAPRCWAGRTHRTLGEARDRLGERLDLVVVCVPATDLVPAVTDAVGAGARSLVVITAGLSERDPAGAAAEQRGGRGWRDGAGAVLVGPNCIGLVDTSDRSCSSRHDRAAGRRRGRAQPERQPGARPRRTAARPGPGGVAVRLAGQPGGPRRLVDLMRACVDHDATRAVAVYAEDVVDGRAFVAAARALRGAGKPVVLLAPGRSAAAVRSAVSHTGSLTSAYRVVDAACAAAGARRVDNPTQLADLLAGLLGARRMAGRRVAILTDGGGHGAIAARRAGRRRPASRRCWPTAPASALRGLLWPGSTVANPVDLAGAGEQRPDGLHGRPGGAAGRRGGRRRADDRLLRRLLHRSRPRSPGSSTPRRLAMADVVRGQRKPVVGAHDLPRRAHRAAAAGRAASRCTATSTVRAAVLAGLVEQPRRRAGRGRRCRRRPRP